MTEEHIRFTAELSTFGGDLKLREKSDEELKDYLASETNIPADCIEDVEVR